MYLKHVEDMITYTLVDKDRQKFQIQRGITIKKG